MRPRAEREPLGPGSLLICRDGAALDAGRAQQGVRSPNEALHPAGATRVQASGLSGGSSAWGSAVARGGRSVRADNPQPGLPNPASNAVTVPGTDGHARKGRPPPSKSRGRPRAGRTGRAQRPHTVAHGTVDGTRATRSPGARRGRNPPPGGPCFRGDFPKRPARRAT